jgi:hypothetical protein
MPMDYILPCSFDGTALLFSRHALHLRMFNLSLCKLTVVQFVSAQLTSLYSVITRIRFPFKPFEISLFKARQTFFSRLLKTLPES